MKKILVIFGLSSVLLLTGCGTGFPNGFIYTNLNIPLSVNGSQEEIKANFDVEVKGQKLFGLFAWGDVSYEAAMKKAEYRFAKIQRVEYFSHDVCGCGYYGIRIYGEKKKEEGDQK